MPTITPKPPAAAFHHDDIAVWPDGEWACLGEVKRGYAWKSDDYEIVRLEDMVRLRELGILDELI